MQAFPVHTIESAPEQSRPSLEMLQGALGMIPNIAGAMSTSSLDFSAVTVRCIIAPIADFKSEVRELKVAADRRLM